MNLGPTLEPIQVVADSISPVLLAVWVVVSVGLVLLPAKTPQLPLPAWLVFHAGGVAFTYAVGVILWRQVTGEFIPFAQAWPSAFVMGFGFALWFLLFIRVQERTPLGISIAALVLWTAFSGIALLFAFFVMPHPIRWQLQGMGLLT